MQMVAVTTWAICRPKEGEAVSGDGVGLWQDEATTLATVIDGLGSGPAAAEAMQRALACVELNRHQPLTEIMRRCHRAVQGSRGVVMALVRIEHERDRLRFVGVGNVGFSAASAAPMQPVSQNGLVGYRLPALLEFRFDCSPGDLIALYTDGISSRFVLEGGAAALKGLPPQEFAGRIVERFGVEHDDVAVAVLWLTESAEPLSHLEFGANHVPK